MTHGQPNSPAGVSPAGFDWKDVAARRLATLVELEHDYAVVRDRLAQLQGDHHQQTRHMLAMLESLRRERNALADELSAQATLHASFLSSRSWRITQPLRDATVLARRGKGRLKRKLRALLSIPMLHRLARRANAAMPGLGRRVHTLLYGTR